jgi:predicted ATP-grasp superfamily ATP-dependent carboligase
VERGRVLCGVDEATGSLAGVRGLRAAGYEAWLALSQEHTYVAHSRAASGSIRVPDPKEDPERYARRLASEARRIAADIVLPFTEATLRALSGREGLFDGVVLGTSGRDRLDRATDKGLFPQLCREAGLDTPSTVEVTAGSLDRVDVSVPVVLKPQRTVLRGGGVDGLRTGHVLRVTDEDELRREVEERPNETFFAQPVVEGTLAAICGVAWEGRLVCALHQVSPRIWPVGCGISSFAETVQRNDEREAGVARLLELVGWSGIFAVQFIVNAEGAYAIDLNPRIYGSAALAIAAGHNLPAIWMDLLLGRRPSVGAYRVGIRYRVEEHDIRALAVEFHRGNRRRAVRGLLPHRRTVHAVFSLHDPLPALEMLRKALARPRSDRTRARR